MLNSSRRLRSEASGSIYTENYFENIRRNVTNTSTNVVQPRSNECKNYASQGQQSVSGATQSLIGATNLTNEVNARQVELDSVVRSFQELSRLNVTSLRLLQQTLRENRQRFNASNVKTMVASLRVDYANQQSVLQRYRDTITRLRTEIADVKGAVDQISTLQGCS